MLPAFCRVAASLTPSSDSDIRIEVWLPDTGNWNGKFQAVGNGGWAGTITYPAMATALAAGYATTSTDTGHVGNTAAFALGHPEKVIDIGYRAIHEMTVQGKAIVNALLQQRAEAVVLQRLLAWRTPGDHRGAALSGRLRRHRRGRRGVGRHGSIHAGVLMTNAAMQKTSGAYIPPEKYPAVHDAVLQACDGLDGVKDGILENPLACHFDPKVLQCKAG